MYAESHLTHGDANYLLRKELLDKLYEKSELTSVREVHNIMHNTCIARAHDLRRNVHRLRYSITHPIRR